MFCGVHFMAESADILTSPSQALILPDLAAGCSMADLASLDRSRRAQFARAALDQMLALPERRPI